jgi:anti-sigma regulatory factor (Ser/Thr protein kinase)
MSVEVSFPARLDNLEKIRSFIAESGRSLGAGEDCLECLVHAVDEAASNTILHGYNGRTGEIEISVSREGDNLVVRMCDQAPHFNPTNYPMPDLTLPLKKRPLGGLGVYFIRHFCDEVRYRLTSQGDNELTLVKRAF